MNKHVVIAVVIGLILMAGIGLAVKQRNSSSAPSSSAASASSSPELPANAVTIKGYAFSPATLTVKQGTTVTWTSQDAVAHTVTADALTSNAPDSTNIAQGETYGFTFSQPGTYTYHCSLHPSMKGTIVVTQ